MNTSAIQKAIDQAHKEGGGRVVVPTGRFLTGSVELKSNVHLHVELTAELLGSRNPNDYKGLNRWKALILADGATNITISGAGTIDGQGAELALHIDSLFYIGELDSSDYNLVEKRPMHQVRPQLIEFMRCRNIRVTGVTLKDASCWVQTYEQCKNVEIDKIRVDSDAYWNNDGIDVIDCQNVSITNSFFQCFR